MRDNFSWIKRALRPAKLTAMMLSLHLGCAMQHAAQAKPEPAAPKVAQSQATQDTTAPKPLPPLGAAESMRPGVKLHRVHLGGEAGAVWIYLPEKISGKLPCVLIAAAGGRSFHGILLGRGDQPEHLPYARAGFAVIAYETPGTLPPEPKAADIVAAAKVFRGAQAGVANARAALDYALSQVPQLDAGRIYAAGHSSAATLALLVAQRDARIKGCIAYAPVCDVEAHLNPKLIALVSRRMPDFGAFIRQYSPLNGTKSLQCPVFLFHAADDEIITVREIDAFVQKLLPTNRRIHLMRVPSGGHYRPMIREGIPRAIEWLESLPGETASVRSEEPPQKEAHQ